MKNQNTFELIAKIAIRVAVVITLGVLIFLVGFILVKGLPYIKPSMFSFTYNSDNVSLMPALISTDRKSVV